MRSDDAAGGPARTGVRWDKSAFPSSDRDGGDWFWGNPAAVLVIGLLILTLGTWIMASTAPIVDELHNGAHATGTAHDRGTGSHAEWWVTFEVAGKTETHRLLNVDPRALDDGDQIKVVYNPANPSRVARDEDSRPGELLIPSGILLTGLIFTAISGVVSFRRRRAVRRGTATSEPTTDHHRPQATD